ncbi:peritrophin-48 [Eurosta solidaginis]|uniref:peritrophin-48 n=1 Tax=Eurosta solidaginis TaxID=178769 RepID=UPI003531330D
MLAKQFIARMLVLVLVNSISAEYDVDGVCSLVTSGTRIGSIESCQKYYICNKGKATAYECSAGTKFNKNTQTCWDAAHVNCFFGDSNPCVSKTEGFVPKPGSCRGYIYCKNGMAVGTGQCGTDLVFNNGECIYGDCPTTNVNDASFTSICQVLPNEKYFGSAKNCGKWQICKNEKLTAGFCTSDFVFDTESGSCTYKTEKTCDRVTGANIIPDQETFGQCEATTPVMASSECSDYLSCENNLWTLKSCPENFFFDKEKSTCVSRRASVTADCNRCQFSKKTFVNAVDPECRKYLICENGLKRGSSSCKDGYYFDESGQACVKGSASDNYAKTNGACYSSPSS